MEKTYTLTFSREQVMRTVRSFFLRKMGIGYFVALVLLAAVLVFELQSGNHTWFTGVLGSVMFFGIVLPVASMVTHARLGMRRLAELPDRTATMIVTDKGLVVRSGSGSSEIPWKTITQVWQYPTYWLLLSGPQYLMTIPLSGTTRDDTKDLREAFLKANVKIA